MRLFALAAVALCAANAVQAQVGTTPTASPYRDLDKRMELSIVSGRFFGGQDPVGVSPKDGPYIGARYEARFGPVVSLSGRFVTVSTERTLIDPLLDEGERVIGTRDVRLYMVDAGINLNLTGGKSFLNLVPTAGMGLGMAADFDGEDIGGYSMGNAFMLTFNGGIKWLIGSNWQVRADVADHMYQIRYPDSYLEESPDETRVRNGDESVYAHSLALTLGISYRFFR